jgi:enoyl-CoA hydratase/carnithine racemase
MAALIDSETFLRGCDDPALIEAWSAVGDNTAGFLAVDLQHASATRRHLDVDNGRYAPPFCVVIGLDPASGSDADGCGEDASLPDWVDVAVSSLSALDALCERIAQQPVAAATLAGLLRLSSNLQVPDALRAESLAYSTLQHGAGFERWLAKRPTRLAAAPAADPAPVLIERDGSRLAVTLNRAAQRNAFSAAMRDALCEALTLALADGDLTDVVLRGDGPAFCAGGDLTEFGLARDAAIAHGSRMTRSAGWILHKLRLRPGARAEVHGACIGAGIELPAFLGRIDARRDAFFALPEVGFGLVPGAGGTVSLPHRIGRRRTAWLGLSGARIDAETALRWGLVDRILP